MKKLILLTMALALLFSFGCATWKTNTTAGYEVTGATLTEIHDTAKTMCDASTLKADDCTKIKDVYNKTRIAYIAAGDALIVAINAEDAVKQQTGLAGYTKAMNEVTSLIPQLLKLAQSLGIVTRGGN